MILDSSVVVAIVLAQPGWEGLVAKLRRAPAVGIGAPTLVESGIVLSARMGRDASGVLAVFVEDFELTVLALGEEHWQEAVRAWQRWGKGRHPAKLNFGDCLAYALAKVSGRPLCWVGDDFTLTDVRPG